MTNSNSGVTDNENLNLEEIYNGVQVADTSGFDGDFELENIPKSDEEFGIPEEFEDVEEDAIVKNMNGSTEFQTSIRLPEGEQNVLHVKAIGIDGITKAEYQEDLERNIEDLVNSLKNKAFKPCPAKRVYIPKANGKMRTTYKRH